MPNSVSYSDIPPDAIIICPSCGAKNFRTDRLCRGCEAPLDEAKRAFTKGRGKLVRDIIQKHPELKEKILARLSLSELPGDDFYLGGDALKDISYWDEKVQAANHLEMAGRHEEAARQYEDLGLWSEAGRVRSKRNQVTREREIVLIKCSYCGSLNPQGTLKCSSCGGRI